MAAVIAARFTACPPNGADSKLKTPDSVNSELLFGW
jgi:hypothetical protein